MYFGDIGGAQSTIYYFEIAGARKCRPEENPYVCIYHLLKFLGIKYGSIRRNAKRWETKSINFTITSSSCSDRYYPVISILSKRLRQVPTSLAE